MPKMKSNSGAKKRFRFTAGGKLKRKKAYLSHILTKKARKRKRKLKRSASLTNKEQKAIKRLLPYSG